jgi:small subunit ribosomal protein S6
MAQNASYDLFVLLDPESPEERRAEIIEQIKGQISSGGALKGDADWGMRRLTFEIDHRNEAQYHLFQFEGPAQVLNELDRTLSIEDSVLRHRIIRLRGEAPEVTPRPSSDDGGRREERERGGGGRGRGPRPSDGDAAREGEARGGEPSSKAASKAAAPPAEAPAAPAESAPAEAAPAEAAPAEAAPAEAAPAEAPAEAEATAAAEPETPAEPGGAGEQA